MLPYLDYKKIAEKHMEETGGRLFREMYIENGTTPPNPGVSFGDSSRLSSNVFSCPSVKSGRCVRHEGILGMRR